MDKNADIDALGRVLKATYTLTTGVSGTTVQTFAYDGLSRLKTATDNNQAGSGDDSIYACAFDSLSRCYGEEQNIGSASNGILSAYDANSNLTALTYSSKFGGGNRVISYSYDNLDRVNSVSEDATQLASYSFYGPGRINQRKYRPAASSPMTTTFNYDAVRRVTNIEHSNLRQPNGATPITLDFDYAFDREGSVIAEHATHEGTNGTKQIGLDFYSYDSAYRLTKEFRGIPGTLPSNNIATNPTFTGTASDDRAWTLDGVTNWKSYIDKLNGVATTTTRAVNNVNEYGTVTVGGGTPVVRTHDNNGNLTDDGTNLYEYDALNRLVKVTRKSDSVVIALHAWDADDRRVLHTVTDGMNNVDLRFFYKHGALIEETNASGTLVKQHVFGGMGERIETLSSTETLYLFEKIDGSIASYANSSKIVKSYYDYKAQGLARLVAPNIDSTYFTSDDTYSSLNANNANDYLWQGVRIDFETGFHLFSSSFSFLDPINGRSINFLKTAAPNFGPPTIGPQLPKKPRYTPNPFAPEHNLPAQPIPPYRIPKNPNNNPYSLKRPPISTKMPYLATPVNGAKLRCGVDYMSVVYGKWLTSKGYRAQFNLTVKAKFKSGNGFAPECCEFQQLVNYHSAWSNRIYSSLGFWEDDGYSRLDDKQHPPTNRLFKMIDPVGIREVKSGRNWFLNPGHDLQYSDSFVQRIFSTDRYNKNCISGKVVAQIGPAKISIKGVGPNRKTMGDNTAHIWRNGKVSVYKR